MKSHYAPQRWLCEYTHLMINIYMVAVKRIYQVFTLGIRLLVKLVSVQGQNRGLETQWVEHERFHKRRQVVVTQDIKSSLFSGSTYESCSFCLLFSCLLLNTPL